MIVSHKHKYVFIKATKVAGTSVEIALSPYCGSDDVLTPVSGYDNKSDSSKYNHKPRNYRGLYNHASCEEIIDKIGQEAWDEYFKFSVVRNPWDLVVSRYWWEIHKSGKLYSGSLDRSLITQHLLNPKSYIRLINRTVNLLSKKSAAKLTFNEFVENFQVEWTNNQFYYDSEGQLAADYYIRFENLNEGIEHICEQIGLPQLDLLKTKSKVRKNKKHYSQYYDDRTRALVSELFSKQISDFNYKFESYK